MENISKESKLNLAKYIIFFANRSKKNLYKTKLNKLLFYTQFSYFKQHKERLLEDEFICDYHGPAITELDTYLKEFEEKGLIKKATTIYGTVIVPKVNLFSESYTRSELEILNKVIETFDRYTSSEISDYSHRENLWMCSSIKDPIDINRAVELNDF